MPKSLAISIVIPAYNSEGWITKTVEYIDAAVGRSPFTVEVVMINDGSTDNTLAEMQALQPKSKRLTYKIVDLGKNKGRYLARRAGVAAAQHDSLLFIDSRVFIDKDSLKYLAKKLADDPNQVWNGHVHVAKEGNVFARFWDALVCIAWRRYFAHPREVSYGVDDFDYYPKGTGFFFVPKKLLKQAMSVFEKRGGDLMFSSDDTLLIRYIASKQPIHLSPDFSCVYNGRSTLKRFLVHAYHRGQFFVDGFFRPGNRFFMPLLGVLAVSLAGLLALLLWPVAILKLLVVLLLIGTVALFVGGLVLRLTWKDAASLAWLSPFFGVVYGAGIWRGVARKLQTMGLRGVWNYARRYQPVLSGTILEYGLVFLFFTLLTFLYTDNIVLHINHQLFINGPGDGTAGFLWLNYAGNHLNPLSGHTNIVNYPYGAPLGSPTYVAYTALLTPLWVLSHIFTPIVALNLVTFWGFLSGGFAMYWLLKRLTHNAPVSLLAGFAVAFSPFHLANSSMHLSYIFSIDFVLILAAFIGLWRKQTWKRALLLAATVALAFYTDAYFLLFASLFLLTLIGGGLLSELLFWDKQTLASVWRKVRYLALACACIGVLAAPIGIVQLTDSGQVNNTLSHARGDIVSEISYYSARPLDFLLPPLYHPVLRHSQEFNLLQAYKNTRSNPGESTLYIGYAIILLCLLGVVLTTAYVIRRRGQTLSRLSTDERNRYLLIGSLCLVAVPILISFTLPLHAMIHGHRIPLPPELFIKYNISFWRVLTRLFLPIHVLLVLFGAMSLSILFKATKPFKDGSMARTLQLQWLVAAVLIGVLAFEYATGFNRPAFDFNHMPKAYSWLAQQKDIPVVAEFPFIGKPWDPAAYDVTAQMIHHKKLVNLQLPEQDPNIHNGLVVIDNPEAVDYVVLRGAQVGITHGERCNLTYPWLTLIYNGEKDPAYGDKQYSPVCIYRLHRVTSDKLFIDLYGAFASMPTIKQNSYADPLYGNYAEMKVINDRDAFVTKHTPARLTLTLGTAPAMSAFKGHWRILQDNIELANGEITGDQPGQVDVSIDASKTIQIRITDVDGNPPAVYQVAASDIVVTAL